MACTQALEQLRISKKTDVQRHQSRFLMGKPWWDTEMAKAVAERHPVVRWFGHWVQMSSQARREENGLLSSVPDGIMSALLLLFVERFDRLLSTTARIQSCTCWHEPPVRA